ncbi:Diacylglycerol kinase family enzyme [Ferrithrix thermotolerans DSM 19514]|uniref:Diacylglycerol kinase family enzyme n=1 Tax=Ferrithrix thermotolerans DSM 19514 TaxID=1121881 RepID=A0A1M4WND7_9ACTN|nr:diacylglycerol kinase family protein [Ferrithrix thermotolerans]SHE82756.1 Diacylglycerol kinase family enzyme [Ferrithrix thermotolerans DSM 19514]
MPFDETTIRARLHWIDKALSVAELYLVVVVSRRLYQKGMKMSLVSFLTSFTTTQAMSTLLTGDLYSNPGLGVITALGRINPSIRNLLWGAYGLGAQMTQSAVDRPLDGRSIMNKALLAGAATLSASYTERVYASLVPKGRIKTKKAFLVVNQDSGSHVLARRAARILRLIHPDIQVSWVGRDEIESELDRAISAVGVEGILIVAGGDGTVSLACSKASKAGICLAILPAGTGNDTARSLLISLHPEQAAMQIANGKERQIDLGESPLGRFAHAVTVGMTAEFSASVQKVRGKLRPLVYPYNALAVFLRRKDLHADLSIDGAPIHIADPMIQLAVINAPRLGGRLGVTLPGASLDDGFLHVIALYKGAARESLRSIVHLLRSGQQITKRGVVLGRGREVEVRTKTKTVFSVDGEPVETTSMSLAVRPKALRIIVG